MIAAHILPPAVVSDAEVIAQLGDIHMVLPALINNHGYRGRYRAFSDTDWLILDNGIAEGRAVDFVHLLSMAKFLQAQELVLPDVMHDMDKTLRAIAQVFYFAFENRHKHKFMLVLQGKDMSEAEQCAERAMNMFPGIIHSFGIPRHFAGRQRRATRIGIADRLRYHFPGKSIHLLGTHPENPFELLEWADNFHSLDIRSCDTSLAWNATKAGVQLKGPESLSYNLIVERQHIDDFAHASLADVDKELLLDNIRTINDWTRK